MTVSMKKPAVSICEAGEFRELRNRLKEEIRRKMRNEKDCSVGKSGVDRKATGSVSVGLAVAEPSDPERRTKIQQLRQSRDYSFLNSENNEIPTKPLLSETKADKITHKPPVLIGVKRAMEGKETAVPQPEKPKLIKSDQTIEPLQPEKPKLMKPDQTLEPLQPEKPKLIKSDQTLEPLQPEKPKLIKSDQTLEPFLDTKQTPSRSARKVKTKIIHSKPPVPSSSVIGVKRAMEGEKAAVPRAKKPKPIKFRSAKASQQEDDNANFRSELGSIIKQLARRGRDGSAKRDFRDDDDALGDLKVSSFSDIQKEERRSLRLGKREDEIERKKLLEEQMKAKLARKANRQSKP